MAFLGLLASSGHRQPCDRAIRLHRGDARKGEPLERALPDAGIERLRPVMITVGATILALFPLALEGGPLWKPLCYAQIGGLAVATFITLLLVRLLRDFCLGPEVDYVGRNSQRKVVGFCRVSNPLRFRILPSHGVAPPKLP